MYIYTQYIISLHHFDMQCQFKEKKLSEHTIKLNRCIKD